MGSMTFQTTGTGSSPRMAFTEARMEAGERNGHREGYSGDIQTSTGFLEMDHLITKGESIRNAADRLFAERAELNSGEYVCGCLKVRDKDDGTSVYLFFGWGRS